MIEVTFNAFHFYIKIPRSSEYLTLKLIIACKRLICGVYVKINYIFLWGAIWSLQRVKKHLHFYNFKKNSDNT